MRAVQPLDPTTTMSFWKLPTLIVSAPTRPSTGTQRNWQSQTSRMWLAKSSKHPNELTTKGLRDAHRIHSSRLRKKGHGVLGLRAIVCPRVLRADHYAR